MITLVDYFTSRPHSAEHRENAVTLLYRVNNLLADAINDGVRLFRNPRTDTYISGQTEGGFRLESSKIGAKNSSHKEARGIDVYDYKNALDDWLNKNPNKLLQYDLYREHPKDTESWCHLTTRPPKSGNRTFLP